jgi:uncharacterized protein (DUF4415 family)
MRFEWKKLETLRRMKDEEIDFSDIPEKTDWSKAVKGKFYRPRAELKVSVYLEPDVAKKFRSSADVNEALRSFLRVSKASSRLSRPVAVRSRQTLRHPQH